MVMRSLAEYSANLARAWGALKKFRCDSCGWSYTGAPLQVRERLLCYGCWNRQRLVPPDRETFLQKAGVPSRYHQPFEEPARWPVDPRTGRSPADWNGDPWSVALFGADYGGGKSMLAAELLWRLHRPGSGWTRAGQLVAGLFGRLGRAEREAAQALFTAPALVVDELGRAHTAPETWEALSELLGARYDWKRPTIITTNLTRAALKETEGSLYDRLRDGLLVPVAGVSRRGVKP